MSETLLADEWIRTTLAADTGVTGQVGTRLYPDLAPQQAVFPLIVWSLQDAMDVVGQGTFRIMVRCTYTIKVTGKTRSYWQLKPAFDAMDSALHGAGGDTTNAHIFACMRTEEYRLAEFVDNEDYRTLGGMYQLLVQKV
jgi:hypothetical protein